MKSTHSWHDSQVGLLIRWLGSIQLAIPLLVLVAAALVWGTYIESTGDAKTAKAIVYGSYWFITLMALICASLVFAVVTRFPWEKRHIGFIVVHASLVAMIAGGFWSLFGRVEGRMIVQQGTGVETMETDEACVEVVEHQAGQFTTLGVAPAPTRPGKLTVGSTAIDIAELWENCREVIDVVDGGPEPFRAFQVSLSANDPSPTWIGDEARGTPYVAGDVAVRVFAVDREFTPSPGVSMDTIVIHGTLGAPRVTLLSKDGTTREVESKATFPWSFDFGQRRITLHAQLANAQELSHFVRVPPAKDFRPAMVVRQPGGGTLTPVAWKAVLPLQLPDRAVLLRYGPRLVKLPFAIRLDRFNKKDYPGTDMAMSYESDVTVAPPTGNEFKSTISMNNPLKQSGWKVYQASFMGDQISIFSVMKDPGLPLTYASSIGLCVGILITFYGRKLSRGHPGIPALFARKELSHDSHSRVPDPLAHHAQPLAGKPAIDRLGGQAGLHPDPARGADHAPGLVREGAGVPADRA